MATRNKQKEDQMLNLFKAFLATQSGNVQTAPKAQAKGVYKYLCFVENGSGQLTAGFHRDFAKDKNVIAELQANGVNKYIVKTADGKWTTETR
jgi:hypothetical protein